MAGLKQLAESYKDLNLTNVYVDSHKRRIILNIRIRFNHLYSYLKELWKDSTHYITKPFPVAAITQGYFIFQNGWNFDEDSANLIMDAGWAVEDSYMLQGKRETYISEQYLHLHSMTYQGEPIEEGVQLYYGQYPRRGIWVPIPIINGKAKVNVKIYERFEDKWINNHRDFLEIRGVYKGRVTTMNLKGLWSLREDEELRPHSYGFPVDPLGWGD